MIVNNAKGKPCSTGVLAALLAISGAHAADCEPGDAGKAAQARQKIALLDRLTTDSEPLRRLRQQGDQVALATLDNALSILQSARESLDDGCSADAAALSNEALRLATEAFRASSSSGRDERSEFNSELEQARSYLASFDGRDEAETGLSAADIAGIERQLRNAESLAATGSVAEARRLLLPVNDRLQRRLLEMFDQRTIYYEHEFATPADEFAYLTRQFDGYMLLIRKGEKPVPYSARKRVDDMMDSAAQFEGTARRLEGEGDWHGAITAMHAALEHCERAARAIGYAY